MALSISKAASESSDGADHGQDVRYVYYRKHAVSKRGAVVAC